MEKQNVILVVDDNEFIRTSMKFYLKKNGFEVHEADSGYNAVELSAQIKPDLIVMDLMMPVLNGMDATAQIRENLDTPIIIVTAHATKEHVIKGTQLGINGFLVKPFEEAELLALIDKTLN